MGPGLIPLSSVGSSCTSVNSRFPSLRWREIHLPQARHQATDCLSVSQPRFLLSQSLSEAGCPRWWHIWSLAVSRHTLLASHPRGKERFSVRSSRKSPAIRTHETRCRACLAPTAVADLPAWASQETNPPPPPLRPELEPRRKWGAYPKGI